MRRRILFVTLTFLLGASLPARAANEAAHVYIVLIDGLDARLLNEQLTPTLWGLAHGSKPGTTFYPHAQAIMPTVTNTNHAAIMTASYAQAHGLIGNMVWDRQPGHSPSSNQYARYLQVETLFTVIEKERPAFTTAGIFGKARLVDLFADVPGKQRRPDILWGDVAAEDEPVDARAGLASDQRTMEEALRVIALERPDFLFLAIADVDHTAHRYGPDSHEARKAVLEADRQIDGLIKFLLKSGLWEDTVVMITADHGFASVAPGPGRPFPLILFGRELLRAGFDDVVAIGSGGVETIWLPTRAGSSPGAADGKRLAELRALALAQPEIAEAWYRTPNASDGGDAFTVAHNHPDWRIDSERGGELLLVARPNHYFGDPFKPGSAGYVGSHGGPAESHIPILITGGSPRLGAPAAAGEALPAATNPDLGATAAWLLGVRSPRTTNGKAIPEGLAGRVLREALR